MAKPLCPHCLRGGCPWLAAYDNYRYAVKHNLRTDGLILVCPLRDLPLAPNVRKRLLARLGLG